MVFDIKSGMGSRSIILHILEYTLRFRLKARVFYPLGDNKNVVCLVVDGSKGMGESNINWPNFLRAFNGGTQLNVIIAQDEPELWQEDFTADYSTATEWISSHEYAGGCDPVPALEMAWDLCSNEKGNGTIIWIHAPYPVSVNPVGGLRQRLFRRPADANGKGIKIYDVAIKPGPNRIMDKLGDLASVERLPVIGSIDTTLVSLAEYLNIGCLKRKYSLIFKENKNSFPPGAISTTGHLARLGVFNHIRQLARMPKVADRQPAAELAIRTRLVTPVSGAVVLERAEQYSEFALDPTANSENIPAIPEPEEWALIIIAILALLILYYKRRREIVHA